MRVVGSHPRPALPELPFPHRGHWGRDWSLQGDPALGAGVAARRLKSMINCSLLIAAPHLPSASIGIFQIHVSGSVYQLSRTAVTSLREERKHLPGSGRQAEGMPKGAAGIQHPHRTGTAPASPRSSRHDS